MLDNKPMQDQQIPPYHLPGRWYKVEFALNYDTSVMEVTKSDLPDAVFYTISRTAGGHTFYNSVLFMGKGFKLIDWKITGNIDQSESSDGPFTPGLYGINPSYTDLDTIEIGLSLGDEQAQVYLSGTIYVFGYFE